MFAYIWGTTLFGSNLFGTLTFLRDHSAWIVPFLFANVRTFITKFTSWFFTNWLCLPFQMQMISCSSCNSVNVEDDIVPSPPEAPTRAKYKKLSVPNQDNSFDTTLSPSQEQLPPERPMRPTPGMSTGTHCKCDRTKQKGGTQLMEPMSRQARNPQIWDLATLFRTAQRQIRGIIRRDPFSIHKDPKNPLSMYQLINDVLAHGVLLSREETSLSMSSREREHMRRWGWNIPDWKERVRR